jgi:AraC family transcriptional regulator of adaptative response / DNA-3-methyladenine glycosylase II
MVARPEKSNAPRLPAPPRVARLSAAKMYDRFLAGDPAYNGRFFTGVKTTGIYCLPSCRARKPKRANIAFYPTAESARAAGFRPCKKCHPDDFARGADLVLETIETVVAEVRADPAAFPNVRSIVRRTGFGSTRAFELFRQHYHTTPADLLSRARVAAAGRRLLNSSATLAAVALEVGYESLSAFHENFRQITGLTPGVYRELPDATTFRLVLPSGYLLNYLRRALSRDAQSVSEKLEGNHYTAALQTSSGPVELKLTLAADHVMVECPQGAGVDVHSAAVNLLGLDEPAVAFARLAQKLGLSRLVAGREQFRISRTASVFDGVLWAIIGQQINLPFACTLKRRLFEHAGTRLPSGLIAPPSPAALARLSPTDLLPLQFSRQKAAYVIHVAQLVASGKLDLDGLRGLSATRAERTLLAIRGLGPWSVNYLMMRSLGFPDCVPLGDTGVTSGLQSLFKLEERPDVDATRRLMAVFSPHRSLATAHLWQFGKPIPE